METARSRKDYDTPAGTAALRPSIPLAVTTSSPDQQMLRWALSFEQERAGDVFVLATAGRMSAATSGQLIEQLVAALDAGERRIVVDLARVDYACSAALMALQAVYGRVYLNEARLVLCSLDPSVRLALDLAGLLEEFEVAETRAAAVEQFGRPAPN